MSAVIKLHAEKSASASFRWAICHASIKRQRGRADSSSNNMAAKRGTVAHDLAEKCLKMQDTVPLSMALGKDARVNRDGTVTYLWANSKEEGAVTVDEEMIGWVETYIELVNRLAMGGELLVEQSLSIEHITAEDGAKGTTDATILYEKAATVADLKTGFVKVFASYELEGDLFLYAPPEMRMRKLSDPKVRFPNPQLVIYADAALKPLRFWRDFESVTLIISQPSRNHIDEYTLSIADFDIWVQWLREQAAATESDNPRVVPGEKQCQYCRAYPCDEVKTLLATTAIKDFESIDATDACAAEMAEINRAELGKLKTLAPLFRTFANRIDTMTHAELAAGRSVPGYKLVLGDMGDRKWTDEAKAYEVLGWMLDPDKFTKRVIASPTQIEALVINKRPTPNRILTQEQWDTLKAHVTRSPASPKVVPSSDPRPVYAPDFTAGFDFDDSHTPPEGQP